MIRFPGFVFIISCLTLFSRRATAGEPDTLQPVLIVMDMQEHFTNGTMTMEQADSLIGSINEIIRLARPKMDVVFVRANVRVLNISLKGIHVESIEGQDLDPRLYRKKGDPEFVKDLPSAFTSKELSMYLDTHSIGRVYLTGLYIEQCLGASAEDGIERGYEMVIISEGAALKKERRRDRKLEKLRRKGVVVITTERFAELAGQ